ncbi:MAG: FtsX-like permease family protein [Gammaproteobacteria bacterium]|nr:FtsX-like permease family protein [Gammaproteobacteria bacterium]
MFFLAIRHLMSRKRQTTLIFLGISLGTMMYTVISGLQLGMRDFITERLLNNTSHIKISAREQIIDQGEMTRRFYGEDERVRWLIPPAGLREEAHIIYPQGWFDRLREDPEVLGYSPSLAMSVIISKGKTRLPSSLVGIIPALHSRVMKVEEYIKQGSLFDLSGGGHKVIVGKGMLDKLGLKVGDTILASSGLSEPRPLKIVGVLEFGIKGIDDAIMFGALRDVQAINRTPGRISDIAVNLVDMNRAHDLAAAWGLTSADKVESWEQANANFMEIFKFQDIVRLAVTFAILLVAGFGIYNVLSIMISQKKREIAILRSIGYPPKYILELFLTQGIILGITGAIIGLLFGHFINLYLSTIELGRQGPMGGHLIISYAPSIYLSGFLLAFVSAVLASILPAHAASRLTPLEIIRSEV